MEIPPGPFFLGVTSAAYQIEGAVHEDGRGASIWDVFCRRPGAIRDGSNGDSAADGYRRWQSDLDLLQRGGVGAYRFSVAWPRVQPDGRTRVNPRGLDFYDRLVDGLLARGIEPWPCLYHWDLPHALEQRGGWPLRDTAYRFAEYAAAVASRLGDRARWFGLIYEAATHATFGHLLGRDAPGRSEGAAAAAALHHLNLGCAEAARTVREVRGGLAVGTILAWDHIEAATDRPADRAAAERARAWLADGALLPLLGHDMPEPIRALALPVVEENDPRRLRTDFDWLGLSYGGRVRVAADPAAPALGAALGTPDPQSEAGLRLEVERLARAAPGLALVVMLRGFPRPFPEAESQSEGRIDDPARIRALEHHLDACVRAAHNGSPIRGCFVSPWLDGFEWSAGFTAPAGLVACAPRTLVRTPKASWDRLSQRKRPS